MHHTLFAHFAFSGGNSQKFSTGNTFLAAGELLPKSVAYFLAVLCMCACVCMPTHVWQCVCGVEDVACLNSLLLVMPRPRHGRVSARFIVKIILWSTCVHTFGNTLARPALHFLPVRTKSISCHVSFRIYVCTIFYLL